MSVVFFFWEGETGIIFERVENLSSGLENYATMSALT